MSIGFTEVLMIALVVLVLFGGARLGAIGKGLGEGIRNFKKGLAGEPEASAEPPKEPPQLPAKTEAGDGAVAEASSKTDEPK